MNLLFNDLNIKDFLKEAIEFLGLTETTEIQSMSIPVLLEGEDIIGQAKTGTGKTFAYGLPLLNKIDASKPHTQSLIILPTRELANQVYKEFLKLLKFNRDIKVCLIVGGESYTKQFANLKTNPHVVISTPGRTIDHLERGTIDFSHLDFLILDEADEMLKMGFEDDLEMILKTAPKERQTALFSATIPPFIKQSALKYQNNPKMIKVSSNTLAANKIRQCYYMIKKSERNKLLLRTLDFHNLGATLIFANTKVEVDEVNEFLLKNGYQSSALHGDLKQKDRDFVLNNFRNKRTKYLIATDVAARGLDITHLDLVINYELPFENELYVHRIGRTGRASKSGMSISFVYPSSKNKLMQIEKFINQKMEELEIPSVEQINKVKDTANYVELLLKVNETNDHSVNPIVSQLLIDGYTEMEIINALLGEYKTTKEYEDIEITKQSNREDRRKNNLPELKKKGRNIDNKIFRVASINLGKKDGIKAVSLTDYFKKRCDLYPKNIGDITVKEHETVFEIHKAAIHRIDQINNKFFNNKKLKVKLID